MRTPKNTNKRGSFLSPRIHSLTHTHTLSLSFSPLPTHTTEHNITAITTSLGPGCRARGALRQRLLRLQSRLWPEPTRGNGKVHSEAGWIQGPDRLCSSASSGKRGREHASARVVSFSARREVHSLHASRSCICSRCEAGVGREAVWGQRHQRVLVAAHAAQVLRAVRSYRCLCAKIWESEKVATVTFKKKKSACVRVSVWACGRVSVWAQSGVSEDETGCQLLGLTKKGRVLYVDWIAALAYRHR